MWKYTNALHYISSVGLFSVSVLVMQLYACYPYHCGNNSHDHMCQHSTIWHKRCIQGPDSIYRCHLTSIGKLIVEIRRSYDRLISTMGFAILVRWHLYIESGPWCFLILNCMMHHQLHIVAGACCAGIQLGNPSECLAGPSDGMLVYYCRTMCYYT